MWKHANHLRFTKPVVDLRFDEKALDMAIIAMSLFIRWIYLSQDSPTWKVQGAEVSRCWKIICHV